MSIKSDAASGDPVLMGKAIKSLLQRVERLEKSDEVRDGVLIGETEHGDRVYSKREKPHRAKTEDS